MPRRDSTRLLMPPNLTTLVSAIEDSTLSATERERLLAVLSAALELRGAVGRGPGDGSLWQWIERMRIAVEAFDQAVGRQEQ